jgi:vacuolar protein sorting-associated protein 41
MGTRKGRVYILDVNGNMNQTFSNHDSSISELSIDDRGEFIATSSLSGEVPCLCE